MRKSSANCLFGAGESLVCPLTLLLCEEHVGPPAGYGHLVVVEPLEGEDVEPGPDAAHATGDALGAVTLPRAGTVAADLNGDSEQLKV